MRAELRRAVRYIWTTWGPICDQSKRAAWARPRSRRRSRGSDRLRMIAREALAELPLRKTCPMRPSSSVRTSTKAGRSEATTGAPQAIASSSTMPKLSRPVCGAM